MFRSPPGGLRRKTAKLKLSSQPQMAQIMHPLRYANQEAPDTPSLPAVAPRGPLSGREGAPQIHPDLPHVPAPAADSAAFPPIIPRRTLGDADIELLQTQTLASLSAQLQDDRTVDRGYR